MIELTKLGMVVALAVVLGVSAADALAADAGSVANKWVELVVVVCAAIAGWLARHFTR